ncbi:hypothetical protein CHARACLAT_032435 [Characodon lateralis]|uniref:Uncharacterized protein n=1 Tax=Characodon lateralis TaxID=208331 RepID=A0ABU7EPG1_9TELE|nr:hypothetical protein [Characodon lateralis]
MVYLQLNGHLEDQCEAMMTSQSSHQQDTAGSVEGTRRCHAVSSWDGKTAVVWLPWTRESMSSEHPTSRNPSISLAPEHQLQASQMTAAGVCHHNTHRGEESTPATWHIGRDRD